MRYFVESLCSPMFCALETIAGFVVLLRKPTLNHISRYFWSRFETFALMTATNHRFGDYIHRLNRTRAARYYFSEDASSAERRSHVSPEFHYLPCVHLHPCILLANPLTTRYSLFIASSDPHGGAPDWLRTTVAVALRIDRSNLLAKLARILKHTS